MVKIISKIELICQKHDGVGTQLLECVAISQNYMLAAIRKNKERS